MYTAIKEGIVPYNSNMLALIVWCIMVICPIVSHNRMERGKAKKTMFPIWLLTCIVGSTLAKQYDGFDPYYTSNSKAPSSPLSHQENYTISEIEPANFPSRNSMLEPWLRSMVESNYSECEEKETCHLDYLQYQQFGKVDNSTDIAKRAPPPRSRWYTVGNTAFVNTFTSFSYNFWTLVCSAGIASGNFIPCVFSAVFAIGTFIVQAENQRLNADGSQLVYTDSGGQFNNIQATRKNIWYTDSFGNTYTLVLYHPDPASEQTYVHNSMEMTPMGHIESDIGVISIAKSQAYKTQDDVNGFNFHYMPFETHENLQEHFLNKRMYGRPEVYDFIYEFNGDNMAMSDVMKGPDVIGNSAEQEAEIWNNEAHESSAVCRAVYTDDGKMYNQRTIATKDGVWQPGELDSYRNNVCQT